MFKTTLLVVFAIVVGMVQAAPTSSANRWQMPKGFPNITYVGLSTDGFYYDFNVTFTMGSMYGMSVSWNISDILPNWARRADKYDVYTSRVDSRSEGWPERFWGSYNVNDVIDFETITYGTVQLAFRVAK